MALKFIAGTLPSFGVYAIVPGLLQRLPSGSWELSAQTVHSVELVHVGKEYNYAKGGMGMFAGGAVAGPVGMLVGGILPKAFKDDVIQFVIRFRNGDVAHFSGSQGDYKRALNSSYQGSAPVPTPQSAAPIAPERETEQSEIERLRAEVAALRGQREPEPIPQEGIAPEPLQQTLAGVRPETAAEREAKTEALDGHSRLWFADVAQRQYVTAAPNETPAERKQREAQNEQYRKEYKAALRVVRKQHEKDIQKNQGLTFRERMRLHVEIQKEFDYRTAK